MWLNEAETAKALFQLRCLLRLCGPVAYAVDDRDQLARGIGGSVPAQQDDGQVS